MKAERTLNYQLSSAGGEKHIPALLGKACILFNMESYADAITQYRKALKINPDCPAAVRVGIGMCFARLKKPEQARIAFDRALELDSNNVSALLGCAILELNKQTPTALQAGLKLLTEAYKRDKTNAITLNHLADHFFHKGKQNAKDQEKALMLARAAAAGSDVEAIQAQSHFQIARIFHHRGELDTAFKHYYQATKLAPTFVLPQFGLGQMYIHKAEREKASECFERVLRVQPDNYETLRILGSLYGQSDASKKRAKAQTYLTRVTKQKPDDVEAWIELASLLEGSDKKGALEAYTKALTIFEEIPGSLVPPEILENIASLKFQLGETSAAEAMYNQALDNCLKSSEIDGLDYYSQVAVTIKYNLARLKETTHHVVQQPRIFRVISEVPEDLEAGTLGLVPGDHVAMLSEEADGRLKGSLRLGNDGDGELSEEGRIAPPLGSFPATAVEELEPTASHMYEDLLGAYPSYTDCIMRLGCIRRDLGLHSEAESKIKEGLSTKGSELNVWTLLGNMHLAKHEYNPGQKKFEALLHKGGAGKDDPYSLLALGNVWMETARTAPESKKAVYLKRATDFYKNVLKLDPHNLYAANGIGCVLAAQGKLLEAKDVFIQVREASTDIPDPWINLAHIYCEQGLYVNAIKLYENCLEKFFGNHDAQVFVYLARAYFKAERFKECQRVLIKALHLSPSDTLLRFNIGIAQVSLARGILEQVDSDLKKVEDAIALLESSEALFGHLKKLTKQKFDPKIADREQKRCRDFLSQAKGQRKKALAREEDRNRKKASVVEQVESTVRAKKEIEYKMEEDRRAAAEEKKRKIAEFKKAVQEKDYLTLAERKPVERKTKRKEMDGLIVTDDDEQGDATGTVDERPKVKKQRKKRSLVTEEIEPSVGKEKKRQLKRDSSDSDMTDDDEALKPKEKKPTASKQDNKLYKSRATVSDSSDDEGDGAVGAVEESGSNSHS